MGYKVDLFFAKNRLDYLPDDRLSSERFHLNRLPMVDGGAYDKWGAYWGVGSPKTGFMYIAESDEARLFIRATSREHAKAQIRQQLPNARFYR